MLRMSKSFYVSRIKIRRRFSNNNEVTILILISRLICLARVLYGEVPTSLRSRIQCLIRSTYTGLFSQSLAIFLHVFM